MPAKVKKATPKTTKKTAVPVEAIAPVERGGGYRPTYHADSTNYCPSCGRSHWLVGRVSAECAFCETALPFRESSGAGQCALVTRIDGTSPCAHRGQYASNYAPNA